LNYIFEYNFLIYILFVFNLFCFFNSSLDWDTSNHLYEARLRNKNFNFKSSYSIGIKIFIIKIYDIFWNTLKKDFRLFRVFTIFLFLLTLIYLYSITPENSEKYLVLLTYFFFISFYNPQTSATEFYSTLVILFVFNFLSSQSDFILLGYLLIVLNSLLFKNIEILYLFPYIFFLSSKNIQYEKFWYLLIFILIIAFVIIFLKKKYFKNLFHYFLNRSFIKQRNFILKNFYLIFPIFYWIIDLYNFVDLKFKILIFTYLVIFFIQRGLTSYFYYPVFILTFFISIKSYYFMHNEMMFQILTLIVFFCFMLSSVINLFYRDYEVTYRILNNWFLFIVKEKLLERELLKFIEKRVKSKFYFWGSKMLVPLQVKNDQLIDQYYSHNHLIIWKEGNIKKKYDEIINLFNTKKPKYIIESGSLKNFKIKKNMLLKYKKIFSNKVGKVYEKI